MIVSLLGIAAGLGLLFLGASGLVRGSSSLALRLGMAPLVIGLTVVALGTSSPELVVCLSAALQGNGGIAIGNVVGSNISNFALILGVAVLIQPARVQKQLIRMDIPIVIGCTLLLGVILLNGHVGRTEGLLLSLGLIAYVSFNVWYSYQKPEPLNAEALPAAPRKHLGAELALTLGGLAALILGAHLFVESAVTIAETLAINQTIIGLTLVAIGTSLPELATSIVAAARGEIDLALGNVIGSNAFNILGIVGVTALVQPIMSPDLDLVSLTVMVGVTLLVLPLMRTGFTLNRPEGLLLLSIYTGYVCYLVLI